MPSASSPDRPVNCDENKVVLRGINKAFGDYQVLHNINIEMAAGGFLTIVGPSGCGKSTLLRVIAGLEFQDSGTVAIGGLSLDNLPPKKRDVAMVFQSFALYPHLSVFDNLAVPLRMRNLSFYQRLPAMHVFSAGTKNVKREISRAVEEIARTLRIEDLLDRKPGQLSGGQKQRVALGRAMVRNPKVFLMDEPLSNLDAKLRVGMRSEIAQLHRRLQVTFIYVTHDQEEAMTMSDQVGVMMEGELLQVDTPGNIYHEPADIRVAKFIGSPQINILPAEVVDNQMISVFGKKIPLRCSLPKGTPLQVGIRPTSFHLESNKPDVGFAGTIRHLENLGSDIYLHVQMAGLDRLVIARINTLDAVDFAIDSNITISAGLEQMMLFDPPGRRLKTAATMN